jgi:hypothetical protein
MISIFQHMHFFTVLHKLPGIGYTIDISKLRLFMEVNLIGDTVTPQNVQLGHIQLPETKSSKDSFLSPATFRSLMMVIPSQEWLPLPNSLCYEGGGVLNLWLYKENKLWDWENAFTLHISPELQTLMTSLF